MTGGTQSHSLCFKQLKVKEVKGQMPQGTETAFPLIPLGAAPGSEYRVHGRGVLAELGAEGLQEEAHPLQAETVPLENSIALGKQRQLSLKEVARNFFKLTEMQKEEFSMSKSAEKCYKSMVYKQFHCTSCSGITSPLSHKQMKRHKTKIK